MEGSHITIPSKGSSGGRCWNKSEVQDVHYCKIVLGRSLLLSLETKLLVQSVYRLCGLVVRVPGYRTRGPGSIPGATRFSE
jgi:hypothetical protein